MDFKLLAGLTSKPHHAHRDFCPAYVDRFACDWHRLATTDPKLRITVLIIRPISKKRNIYFICTRFAAIFIIFRPHPIFLPHVKHNFAPFRHFLQKYDEYSPEVFMYVFSTIRSLMQHAKLWKNTENSR